MRFVYGFIAGLLVCVIGAILYLALGGGEMLLVLSPQYHEMKSKISALEKAEQQRDQLASKLEDLEKRFGELSQRFTDLQSTARREAAGTGAAESSAPVSEPAKP